eukprot:170432-Amphidinium_carterae.5
MLTTAEPKSRPGELLYVQQVLPYVRRLHISGRPDEDHFWGMLPGVVGHSRKDSVAPASSQCFGQVVSRCLNSGCCH